MDKILGLDSAYNEAIEKRGRNMLISANLVSEMVDRIRELEAELKHEREDCLKSNDDS